MTKDIIEQMEHKLKKTKRSTEFMLGSSDSLLSNIRFWVSTGCWPLDVTIGGTGGMGIPGGRLIEVYGDESTGKSLLALFIIAQVQAMGGVALLLDSEGTNTPEFMQRMGVDVDRLFIVYPNTISDVHDDIHEWIEAKMAVDKAENTITPAVVVWDSVASTTVDAEVAAIEEKGLSKATMAVHAREMSKMLRVLPRHLARTGTTAIFVNQTRQKIGVMFGEKQSTFGGKALKFYASVRIKLEVRRPYKVDNSVVGIEVRSTIVKNKVDRPFGKCEFPILFDRGIDNAVACFLYLKAIEVIEARGGWHYITLDGEEQSFRAESWRELFEEHKEYIHQIIYKEDVLREEETIEEEE
jgi:recombination protein RecA